MSSRIADIQSRISALQAPPAPVAPKKAAAADSAAFGSYLDEAVASQTTAAPAAPRQASVSPAPSVLSRSSAPSVSARAPSASAPTYELNSRGIPTDLVAYGNGKIPGSALEQVGGTGARMWAPAAESLTRLIAAARKDGVTIGISDSYRSYAEQVQMAKRKGLYSQGGLAAQPGTSEHGWGMAADLELNARALSWMRAHAGKYGFDENVRRENWHWAYKPSS